MARCQVQYCLAILATTNGFATAKSFLDADFLCLYQRMQIATCSKVQYCLVTLATAKGCLSRSGVPVACTKGHQWQLAARRNVDTTGVDGFTTCAFDARLIAVNVFYLPKKWSNWLAHQACSCHNVVPSSYVWIITMPWWNCPGLVASTCMVETFPSSGSLPCFAKRKLKISKQATVPKTASSCSYWQLCIDKWF